MYDPAKQGGDRPRQRTRVPLEAEVMDERFAQGKYLLDIADVAEYLGVEQTTVQRWCREGSMPAMKIGKEWRIRREALERFLLLQRRVQVNLMGPVEANPDGAAPPIGLLGKELP